jgi:hypothetical protein
MNLSVNGIVHSIVPAPETPLLWVRCTLFNRLGSTRGSPNAVIASRSSRERDSCLRLTKKAISIVRAERDPVGSR